MSTPSNSLFSAFISDFQSEITSSFIGLIQDQFAHMNTHDDHVYWSYHTPIATPSFFRFIFHNEAINEFLKSPASAYNLPDPEYIGIVDYINLSLTRTDHGYYINLSVSITHPVEMLLAVVSDLGLELIGPAAEMFSRTTFNDFALNITAYELVLDCCYKHHDPAHALYLSIFISSHFEAFTYRCGIVTKLITLHQLTDRKSVV